MKRIKKLSTIGTTMGLGAILVTGLGGCQQKSEENTTQQNPVAKENAFVILEEVSPGKYKVAEEFPAKETRIVVKKLDGTEKVLTKEELDKMIKEEAAKVDNGTSNLTKPNSEQVSSGGMSMGEALLASAAGAMLGSWIGSKLFNNPNYQNNRRAGYKNPSTYNRSVNNFGKKSSTMSKRTSTKRSGFFGSSSKGTSSTRSSSYRGG